MIVGCSSERRAGGENDLLDKLKADPAFHLDDAALAEILDVKQFIGCAPSQINYVLATRFSVDHGYIIESRRGGGGYVRIIRLDALRDQLLLGAIHSVGDRLDASASAQLLRNLTAAGGISPAQARLMRTCLDESVLGDDEEADRLRAKLFCRMLTCVLEEG